MKRIWFSLICNAFAVLNMLEGMDLSQGTNLFMPLTYEQKYRLWRYNQSIMQQLFDGTLAGKRKEMYSSPASDFSEGENRETTPLDQTYKYDDISPNKYQKVVELDVKNFDEEYEEPDVRAYKVPDQNQHQEIAYEGQFPKTIFQGDVQPLVLVYHPNGKKLAAGGFKTTMPAIKSGRLKLLETKNAGDEIEFYNNEDEGGNHEDAITAIAFDKDGKSLLSGSKDKKIIEWDLETIKAKYLWATRGPIKSVAYKPDDSQMMLFSLKYHEQASVLPGNEGTILPTLTFIDKRRSRFESLLRGGHTRAVYKAVYNPSRPDEIISLGSDRRLLLWDIRNLERGPRTIDEKIPAVTFALNDKGDQLAVQVAAGAIKIYRLKENACESLGHIMVGNKKEPNFLKPIQAMTYTKDGKELVIAHNGIIMVCDTHLNMKSAGMVGSHDLSVIALASNPVKPSQIASAENSALPIRLWKIGKKMKVAVNTNSKFLQPLDIKDSMEEKNWEEINKYINLNSFGKTSNEPQ